MEFPWTWVLWELEVVKMCPVRESLSGLSMVNDPRICGQPLGPVPISKNGQPSPQAVSFDLRSLYSDEAGLNGMYFHGRYLSYETFQLTPLSGARHRLPCL